MKCVMCRESELAAGAVTVSLERSGSAFVFTGVPALVCPSCGEEYVDAAVSEKLLRQAEAADKGGEPAGVREYAA